MIADLETKVKKIAEMTEYNDHTGACIEIAEMIEQDHFVINFNRIAKQRAHKGGLNYPLYCERNNLYQEMMQWIKENMTRREYKLIYNAT